MDEEKAFISEDKLNEFDVEVFAPARESWLREKAWKSSVAQAVANQYNNKIRGEINWTNSDPGFTIVFDEESVDVANRALLRLYNMMLVPTKNTKIEKILKYRSERKEELKKLWYTLNEMYRKIANDIDPEAATQSAEHELKEALRDVHRTLEEEILYKLKSFAVRLTDETLKEVPTPALTGLGTGTAIGEPLLGAALGTTAGLYQVAQVDYGREMTPRGTGKDYIYTDYLTEAAREGVIDKRDFEIEGV